MKLHCWPQLLAGLLAVSANIAVAGIIDTKHNLSATSGNTVRASSETQVCIFCHTPHNASPSAPLWNRQDPGQGYTPYSSSTVQASPGQPTGASLLCLSCHDGTIALGKVLSRPDDIAMRNGITTIPSGATNLGKDLSNDHPISFDYQDSYSANPSEFVSPGSLTGAVKLDRNGQLQCTSCHEPHDNPFGKFLVKSPSEGALCTTCHSKYGWSQSSHSISTHTAPNGQTVRENACQNCHTPHNASDNLQRLLSADTEEGLCLSCHDGSVAQANIQGEFNKIYRHPIGNTTGLHDPTEQAVVSARHVECMDCHNPHAAKASGTPAGQLTAVRGVSINGSGIAVPPGISNEYELCFRCHGDSPNKAPAHTNRQFPTTNIRQEFNTGNPSYHPVAGVGRNNNVPSLINGLTTGSTIKCTDCHNNNDTNGPRGPHGSIYSPLLERQYLTTDPTTESATAYALCYKCHDRASILRNGSTSFARHLRHITGQGGGGGGGGPGGPGGGAPLSTPCNVCHDPHASQQQKLINFDRDVVSPSSSGRLEYNSLGANAGECYLSCHNRNHNRCWYSNGAAGCGGGGP